MSASSSGSRTPVESSLAPIGADKDGEVAAVGELLGSTRIDEPEYDRTEVDFPAAVAHRLEAKVFVFNAVADVELDAVHADHSVALSSLDAEVSRVVELWEAIRKRLQRRLVARGRRIIVERLMRTLLVVLETEAIEGLLLRSETRPRRPRSLGLQCQVHPFVPAVLIRTPGHDAFRANSEPNPPNSQA